MLSLLKSKKKVLVRRCNYIRYLPYKEIPIQLIHLVYAVDLLSISFTFTIVAIY